MVWDAKQQRKFKKGDIVKMVRNSSGANEIWIGQVGRIDSVFDTSNIRNPYARLISDKGADILMYLDDLELHKPKRDVPKTFEEFLDMKVANEATR